MKVLVACEYSGAISEMFRMKGHDAWSCDLLPGWFPEFHYQGDVFDVINDGWDLLIAHPPCTYLCTGSLNWKNRRENFKYNQKTSVDFVKKLWYAPIDKICIENPRGQLSTLFMKPTQLIFPYQFGHKYGKDVCLWLKNLPPLKGTRCMKPPYKKLDFWSSRRNPCGYSLKSATFPGIARAMADQWGNLSLLQMKG